MHLLPRRREQLLTQVVGDEVIVYDELVHKAFCLSAAAAAIWHRCDGASTADEAARAATRVAGLPVAAETALLTVDAFAREGLLISASTQTLSDRVPDLSRRRALGAMSTGAALLVPAIFAVMAPRPAEAYTCVIGLGGKCVVPGAIRQNESSAESQRYIRHARSRDED